jgi:hypothetical protein
MEQPQPLVQPQFVMMPVSPRNALGAFGFVVALIGLVVPTGVVALLGLVLSLAAIGRSPRGFAACGVILGLLGTAFWFVVMLVALVVGLVAALGTAVAVAGVFVLLQPEVIEVTSDMANVAIAVEEYEQDNEAKPDGLDDLKLTLANRIDPWGAEYRYVITDDEMGFDVVSAGPDGDFRTDDDIRLTRLDRLWEAAFEDFDEKMEDFGRKMERLEGRYASHGDPCFGFDFDQHVKRHLDRRHDRSAAAYERAAVQVLEHADGDGDD